LGESSQRPDQNAFGDHERRHRSRRAGRCFRDRELARFGEQLHTGFQTNDIYYNQILIDRAAMSFLSDNRNNENCCKQHFLNTFVRLGQ
jgi:hypothetical protein